MPDYDQEPQHRYIGDDFPQDVYSDHRAWEASEGRRQQVVDIIGEELPISAEQAALASSVFDATINFYKGTFGIDVSDRMPTVSDVHVLSAERFKALRQELGSDDHGLDIYGFPMSANQMVLRETPNEGLTATLLQHEVLHMIAGGTTRLTQTDKGIKVDQNYGFTRGSSFSAMEEYDVEKTTREIIETRWQDYPALKDLQPVLEGHQDVITLGDIVLRAGVEDSEDRLRDLQLAHITGYPSYLAGLNTDLRAQWGPEVMRDLAVATPGRTAGALAIRLAERNQAERVDSIEK